MKPAPLLLIIATTLSAISFGWHQNDTEQPTGSQSTTAPRPEGNQDGIPLTEEQKEQIKAKRQEQLNEALKNKDSDSLKTLLENDPELASALGNGYTDRAAELMGMKADDPKFLQFQARHQIETDIQGFREKYKELEKKGKAETPQEEAMLKEVRRIYDRHKQMADLLSKHNGKNAGALSLQIEGWDQDTNWLKYNSNDPKAPEKARALADGMATYLRTAGDRQNLEQALRGFDSEMTGYKGLLYGAVKTTNTFGKLPQDQLTALAVAPGNSISGMFHDQLINKSWPEQQKVMKEFRAMRDAAITQNANGEYQVNAEAMKKLKEKFPGYNADWAHAVNDKRSLWGTGNDGTNQAWQYRASNDPLRVQPALAIMHTATREEFDNLAALKTKEGNLRYIAEKQTFERNIQWMTSFRNGVNAVSGAQSLPQAIRSTAGQTLNFIDRTFPALAAQPAGETKVEENRDKLGDGSFSASVEEKKSEQK